MTAKERVPVDRFQNLDRRTAGLAIVVAVVPALYLSWLVADIGLRSVGFVLGWLSIGIFLATKIDPRGLTVAWLRIIAVLLVLTPVFLNLPFLLKAGKFGIGNVSGFILTESDLITVLVFTFLAAIPGGLSYWLDS